MAWSAPKSMLFLLSLLFLTRLLQANYMVPCKELKPEMSEIEAWEKTKLIEDEN
jgi:hypothetical protein